MTSHELKTWPALYAPVARGEKTFELRKNDRGFQVGDLLHLREWEPTAQRYTGNRLLALVTYLFAGPFPGLERGYVVMAIQLLRIEEVARPVPTALQSDSPGFSGADAPAPLLSIERGA